MNHRHFFCICIGFQYNNSAIGIRHFEPLSQGGHGEAQGFFFDVSHKGNTRIYFFTAGKPLETPVASVSPWLSYLFFEIETLPVKAMKIMHSPVTMINQYKKEMVLYDKNGLE